jgi:hypothetical protein
MRHSTEDNFMGKLASTRVTGPDWKDTAVFMHELEKMHCISLFVTMQLVTSCKGLELHVALCASWPDPTKPANTGATAVGCSYPTINARTLETLLFNLCHQLDYQLLMTRWCQAPLPF